VKSSKRPRRDAEPIGIGARSLMVAIAAIAFACGVAIWVLSTHTNHEVTRTTITSQKPAHVGRSRPGHRRKLVTVGRRITVTRATAHENADAEQPVILGLLALAGVLIVASVFSPRISELTFMGVTIKIGKAIEAAVRDVSEEAQDPEIAAGAVMNLLTDLFRQFSTKQDLDEQDVEAAKERVIEGLGRVDDTVAVHETAQGPEIAIDTKDSQPHVTTRPRALLGPDFNADLTARIEAVAQPRLGRRLYATDAQSDTVLAALSFELFSPSDGGPLRVIVDAFATNSDPALRPGVQGSEPILIAYLHAVARKLQGDIRVFLRFPEEPNRELLRTLSRLGLRPARRPESSDMPAGIYWVSEENAP
jgi:hypothetical protein